MAIREIEIQYFRTIAITQAAWDNGIMHKAIAQYLAGIGRKGGSVTSAEKARAARQNGKLGGRPRKDANKKRGTR